MNVIMTHKVTGETTKFECTKEAIATYALANIEMLLQIGLGNSDESIEKHYGGEQGLLDCIERYIMIHEWATADDQLSRGEMIGCPEEVP